MDTPGLDSIHRCTVQCTVSISLCGPDNCTVAAVESYFNSYRIRVATLPPFSYLGIILIYASTFIRFFMFKHKFQIFGDCSHEHCWSVLACLSVLNNCLVLSSFDVHILFVLHANIHWLVACLACLAFIVSLDIYGRLAWYVSRTIQHKIIELFV